MPAIVGMVADALDQDTLFSFSCLMLSFSIITKKRFQWIYLCVCFFYYPFQAWYYIEYWIFIAEQHSRGCVQAEGVQKEK